MNINSINTQTSYTQKTNNKDLKAPTKGAILTTGLLSGTAAYSWTARNSEMKTVMKECGGKSQYIKKFAVGLAIFSGISALITAGVNSISNKIKSTN